MNSNTEIKPLDWNQANELKQLICSAKAKKEALVIDPEKGISGQMAKDLISPSQDLTGSDRFDRHYRQSRTNRAQ